MELIKLKSLSCVPLFSTPWTMQSMEFSRSPTLQAGSLGAESPGKPKNTEVGSLSLLQQIFPTQGSNRGLLHCRRILSQPSHQGTLELIRKFILKMGYIKKTKLKGTVAGNRGPWLLRGGSH